MEHQQGPSKTLSRDSSFGYDSALSLEPEQCTGLSPPESSTTEVTPTPPGNANYVVQAEEEYMKNLRRCYEFEEDVEVPEGGFEREKETPSTSKSAEKGQVIQTFRGIISMSVMMTRVRTSKKAIKFENEELEVEKASRIPSPQPEKVPAQFKSLGYSELNRLVLDGSLDEEDSSEEDEGEPDFSKELISISPFMELEDTGKARPRQRGHGLGKKEAREESSGNSSDENGPYVRRYFGHMRRMDTRDGLVVPNKFKISPLMSRDSTPSLSGRRNACSSAFARSVSSESIDVLACLDKMSFPLDRQDSNRVNLVPTCCSISIPDDFNMAACIEMAPSKLFMPMADIKKTLATRRPSEGEEGYKEPF